MGYGKAIFGHFGKQMLMKIIVKILSECLLQRRILLLLLLVLCGSFLRGEREGGQIE